MKVKIGWIAAGVLALAIGGAYLYDVVQAEQYDFQLVKMKPDGEIYADGISNVDITVRLTKNGKPVKGHTIYIYASNGTLPASRCVTNSNGEFKFRYYPYLYLNDDLTPLEDVTIYLQDESNSTFFMVSAETSFKLTIYEPETEQVWRDWQDLQLEVENVD